MKFGKAAVIFAAVTFTWVLAAHRPPELLRVLTEGLEPEWLGDLLLPITKRLAAFRPQQLDGIGAAGFVYGTGRDGTGRDGTGRDGVSRRGLVTASFIRFELYELIAHATIIRGAALVLNVAVST